MQPSTCSRPEPTKADQGRFWELSADCARETEAYPDILHHPLLAAFGHFLATFRCFGLLLLSSAHSWSLQTTFGQLFGCFIIAYFGSFGHLLRHIFGPFWLLCVAFVGHSYCFCLTLLPSFGSKVAKGCQKQQMGQKWAKWPKGAKVHSMVPTYSEFAHQRPPQPTRADGRPGPTRAPKREVTDRRCLFAAGVYAGGGGANPNEQKLLQKGHPVCPPPPTQPTCTKPSRNTCFHRQTPTSPGRFSSGLRSRAGTFGAFD